MFTVALTGGIASGKSTVARYFAELGVSIIDADQIGRALIDNFPEIRKQLVARFGASLLKKNATIDRDKLRAIIFAHPKDREWLECLLHPLIYQEIESSIQKTTGIYKLVVIPLLLESRTSKLLKKKPSSGNYIQLDRILLVTAPRELQIQRAEERDRLERNQIDAILAAQISHIESIKQADDIIHNESDLQSLHNSTQAMHEKYLSLLIPSKNSLEDSAFLGYYLAYK
ncbi:dephospho-CoA kinase [Rickettsiella endosymbiont of Aleochara curtula]|uniref:dephospho-CoA kinase n=1 Tax=Rickettsiella endosymbiont of Aleochara curtula TaxID=3077936 RepID=UPI00313D5E38